MGKYVHICQKGHAIFSETPIEEQEYCEKCGTQMFDRCPNCGTYIQVRETKGKTPNVKKVAYCKSCGEMFPWIKKRKDRRRKVGRRIGVVAVAVIAFTLIFCLLIFLLAHPVNVVFNAGDMFYGVDNDGTKILVCVENNNDVLIYAIKEDVGYMIECNVGVVKWKHLLFNYYLPGANQWTIEKIPDGIKPTTLELRNLNVCVWYWGTLEGNMYSVEEVSPVIAYFWDDSFAIGTASFEPTSEIPEDIQTGKYWMDRYVNRQKNGR